MGSDVLGGMLKTYINALSAVNKVDQTELTKAMGNAIEDYFTATTIPVASMMDYAGLTDPTTAWVIANYRTLDQTTYAALFTLIGHRYAKTKSDRDTAETDSEFHIPDSLDTYIRSGFSVELDYDEISTSIDLLGITDHGITRDGTPIRFFTQGTLPTVISSLTDSSWTTLYVRVISTNTIELYDTEAHAIDTANTTGRIDFTDQGSGIHELTQQGINIDDAFQKFQVGMEESLDGVTGPFFGWASNYGAQNASASESAQVASRFERGNPTRQGPDYMMQALNDGTNGTPRVTNETRPRTSFAFKIIKIL